MMHGRNNGKKLLAVSIMKQITPLNDFDDPSEEAEAEPYSYFERSIPQIPQQLTVF